MQIDSKVVVITGAAANIGRATAVLFASKGAKIVVNARNNVAGGKKVVEEIESAGGTATFFQADVSDPQQVDKLMRHTIERFGSIDVLINNAGSATPTPPLEATKEDWLKTFDDNFFSSVLCSTAAAKIMQAKGSGRIVNNASVRGLAHGGRSGIIAYSAAKAALISFTKTLAKELSPAITVNAVAPGFTFTSIFDDVPESTKADYIDGTLIKRWITVEEIAEAFLYLACADAVTGEVLVVDGGWNLR